MAKEPTITRQARERIMNEVVYEMMYETQEANKAYTEGGFPFLMRAAMKSAMGKMTMHLIVDQWDEEE